jgi:hypothetical protein
LSTFCLFVRLSYIAPCLPRVLTFGVIALCRFVA